MDEFGSDEENDEINAAEDQPIGDDVSDCVIESDTDGDEILNSTKFDLNVIGTV